jgi:ribulose-5-phosphate 4-epimerase/fuculose-1-phosphate aldolase
MAVVHSHAGSLIPFSITRGKMRPVYHMASFLWSGVPVYEIRKSQVDNDLLIRDTKLGRDLAKSIGPCACVLMRGHGMTVVGGGIPEAVFRSIYTQMNAKLQTLAASLGGPIEFLSDEEGRRATATNHATIERPWELWKAKAMASLKG